MPWFPTQTLTWDDIDPGDASRPAGFVLRDLLRLAERYRYWVFAAVAVWMGLGVNGMWRVGPDTAFYATVARNLLEGKGFVHPTGDASRARPGIVWLFAANFWLFGKAVFWPLVVLMSGLGVAVLGLTYRLIAVHSNRGQALATVVLVAVSSTFYRQTLGVVADLPFLLGLMAFLVGYEQLERRVGQRAINWALLSVAFAWMAMFKITVLVVAGAWFLAQTWKLIRKPRRPWALVGPGLGIAFLGLIRLFDPRGQAGQGASLKEKDIARQLGEHLGSTLLGDLPANVIKMLTETLPEALFGNKMGLVVLTVAVGGLIVFVGLFLLKDRILWGLLVLAFLVQWAMFLPSGRYVLVIIPLLAYAWVRHAIRISQSWPRGFRWPMGALVLGFWIAFNGGRTVGTITAQHGEGFYDHYVAGRYEGLREIGQWLRSHTARDARVLSTEKWANPLVFFSRRDVFEADQDTIDAAASTDEPLYYIPGDTDRASSQLRQAGLEPTAAVFERRRNGATRSLVIYRLEHAQ